MPVVNTDRTWGWPARALHWVIALLMIGLLIVGLYMVEVVGNSDLALRFSLTQTHKSFGFVVFALGLARVIWRLMNPTPAEPTGAAWQITASRWSHWALYGLMFWMPLSGWLMASASPLNDEGAYPFQVKNMVFGLFELPDPFAPGSEAVESIFATMHFAGGIALALILLVHAGAALKHHFVDRDDVLKRMTWGD